jgi:hypothetical protein
LLDRTPTMRAYLLRFFVGKSRSLLIGNNVYTIIRNQARQAYLLRQPSHLIFSPCFQDKKIINIQPPTLRSIWTCFMVCGGRNCEHDRRWCHFLLWLVALSDTLIWSSFLGTFPVEIIEYIKQFKNNNLCYEIEVCMTPCMEAMPNVVCSLISLYNIVYYDQRFAFVNVRS